MTRSPHPDPSDSAPQEPKSFAARLRANYGEGVDPEVSLGGEGPGPEAPGSEPASATSDLLRRLSDHGLKSPRYRLEGEVARGGMGAILRVWDEDLRRHLAMKVVLGKGDAAGSRGTPQVDPRVLARFLEEAQVTGQLDHPGIVPVHELGLDQDGRVYFTMKLVKGRDLKAIFDLVFEEKEGWNETRALSVILRACEAVAYAHKKGVIHRDLKPANIMVGGFGEVFVMDWGLARVLGREDSHDIRIAPEFTSALSSVKTERREERERTESREDLSDSPIVTMDGDVMGTPAYMAPEQARGQIEKLGPRSDVYSMGALLYHLLARRAPYVPAGARVSNRMVLQWVLEGAPKPLHEVAPAVPAELAAIVEKAMAREAERRYPDTLALAEDLRAYTEHRVVSAYETGAVAEFRKWVQRNKPLAAAIAAGLLLAIGGLAWVSIVQSRARHAMAEKNTELAAATKTAQDNERRAVAGEASATRKANDVLSLSAIQDLGELEDRADALWPADPELVPKYEAWLADARLLIEGQPGDESKGVKARPSLAEHESKLVETRARAKPLTPEQFEADRKSSPSHAEWEKSAAQLQWMRRMLGEEPWPSEAEVEAEISKEPLPADAEGLNDIAWKLVDVDPAKIVYGREARGLVLARRAVAAAKDAERTGIRDTLGWALYRCGRLDEALSEERRAVENAQGKQKEDLSGSLTQMQEQVALWKPEGGRSKQTEEATSLAARVAELEGEVSERRTYEFEDGEDRWWHAQLSRLVSDLKSFTDEDAGGLFSRGTSEAHGWGVVKRAEFARTIQERSVVGAEAKRRWDEAVAAVAASPKYGGLKLEAQLGLLPIGADPESGLWEFAHLASGEPVERGSDRKLVLEESMGLVFVLIPGGTFRMGAQSTDPMEPNYDPQAQGGESPVHEVTLSPYFLSKYEMTQGQWERFVGRNPSTYGLIAQFAGHQHNLLHPVEQVTWTQGMEVMSRLGLSLPSEARWERGCRGGTDTAWWTGASRESLRGLVNIADQTAAKQGAKWQDIKDWPDLEDGWVAHAAVGSFPANPFGLHEVHGNVVEWCLDFFDNSFYGRESKTDPVAPTAGLPIHVIRGGGFSRTASHGRSAARDNRTPEAGGDSLGLRPARSSRISASPLRPAWK